MSVAVVESAFAASDTVSVWEPVVARVTEKVPWPFASVESGGSTTPDAVSPLAKWTVPVYPGTGLPCASSATTVMLNACPAVTVVGAVSLRSWTVLGAPFRKALSRFTVICWIRASLYDS